jgi:GNAT superfamily N-acetyltransferase
MWHLAQVKKATPDGVAHLQLLAQQRAEYAWIVMGEESPDCAPEGNTELNGYLDGTLLLVELNAARQVQQIQDATPWILDLIEQYLGAGITPALLQEEVQRAEQWRQSLALKSQELQRRTLEVEARREQIHELEENLKQEKEKLENLAAHFKANLNGTEDASADGTENGTEN